MTPEPPEPAPQAGPPAAPPGQEKKATKWTGVSLAIWIIADTGAYRSIAAVNQANEIWLYEETPTKVIGWRQLPQDLPPST